MVVMFVDCCDGCYGNFGTIPKVGIQRGGSFLIPPEPIAVMLFITIHLHQGSLSTNK
jgi:hypothetical protein